MEEIERFEDLYAILECCPTASHAELKKSYQSLILKHHPDKKSLDDLEDNSKPTDDLAENSKFLRIDRAWKVLRDADLRQKYDAEQQQKQLSGDMIINETIAKNDMILDEISGAYYRPCRCGGDYSIEAQDLNDSDAYPIYLNCSECSLSIEVLLKQK